jgi:hypothetical protein
VQDITAAAILLLLLLLAVWLQVMEAVDVQGYFALLLGGEDPGREGLLQGCVVSTLLLGLCRDQAT